MKIIKALSIIATAVIAIAGILITVVIVFAYTNGNSIFAVQSNSMSPELKKGDLIFVKSINLEQVQVGNILTFRSNNDPKVTFTHRVKSINNAMITTKGDANKNNDPSDTDFAFCIGKVTGKIPLLGYIYMLISLKYGIYLIVILILIYASFEFERYFKSKKGVT